MELSAEAQLDWLRQWESAGPALSEQRARDLRGLSAKRALAASDALLSLARPETLDPTRRTHSGLVEQQELFRRLAGR